jgi:hypothetical protein
MVNVTVTVTPVVFCDDSFEAVMTVMSPALC